MAVFAALDTLCRFYEGARTLHGSRITVRPRMGRANFDIYVNMPLLMVEEINIRVALVRGNVGSMLLYVYIAVNKLLDELGQAVSSTIMPSVHKAAELA